MSFWIPQTLTIILERMNSQGKDWSSHRHILLQTLIFEIEFQIFAKSGIALLGFFARSKRQHFATSIIQTFTPFKRLGKSLQKITMSEYFNRTVTAIFWQKISGVGWPISIARLVTFQLVTNIVPIFKVMCCNMEEEKDFNERIHSAKLTCFAVAFPGVFFVFSFQKWKLLKWKMALLISWLSYGVLINLWSISPFLPPEITRKPKGA